MEKARRHGMMNCEARVKVAVVSVKIDQVVNKIQSTLLSSILRVFWVLIMPAYYDSSYDTS